MTEDKKQQWVAGQLRERGPDRFRRERARAVKQTRGIADKFCNAGRIDREALEHAEDLEDDHALAR